MTRRRPASSRVRALAGALVDPRVGVLHALDLLRNEAGAPAFFHGSAELCNLSACGFPVSRARTDGASADRERAAWKAIAEALRAYCAAIHDPRELPLTSRDAAPFPCAPPASFALFTAAQHEALGFPYAPFTGATQVRWAPALDAASGEPCYVPAALCMLPYPAPPASSEEAAIAPATTTGLACAEGADAAAVAAICDAIRADALAITWQARLAMPHLRVETLPDREYDLVARFERSVGAVTLLDLTTDLGVPVVLAALRCRAPEAPALVFAGGADPDPAEAVRSALEELALTLRYAREIKAHVPPLDPSAGDDAVVDSVSHLRFWCEPANAPRADPLFASKQRIDLDARASGAGPGARDLADALLRTGHQVLLSDLTTSDVRDLGLSVVRAIVPGLHPIFAGHRLRALGGSRLRQLPRELRRPPAAEDGGARAAPHPYLCNEA